MTINGINFKAKNVSISNIDSKAMTTAHDGSAHGLFRGSHKQISFVVDWITASERQELEEARKTKILLVLDTGEKYNVRINLSDFQEIWIDNEPVYNVSITAVAVIT